MDALSSDSGACARDDAGQLPRLAPGQRAARDDLHRIAFLRFTTLVVREQLRRATDELAVHLVAYEPFDFDGDRLLHLGADDATGEGACALGFSGLGLLGAH